MEVVRLCTSCGLEGTLENLDLFVTSSNRPHSKRNLCKSCEKIYSKIKRYKTKYNMTIEDYESLLEQQSFSCKLCSTTEVPKRYGVFHIDHCHTTGKVRGLLCHNCNVGLGNFKDSIVILERAIDYLKQQG